MKRRFAICLILLLALFSPVGAQDGPDFDFEPPAEEKQSSFNVPDVCGIKIDLAEAKLARVTRRYDVIRVPGSGEPGIVFRQEPSPGGKLIGDGRLQLYVTAPLPQSKKEKLADESLPNEKEPEPGGSLVLTFFKLLIFLDIQVLLAYLARKHWKKKLEPGDDEGLNHLQFEYLCQEG